MMFKFYAVVAALLMLSVGCDSNAPEPFTAQAATFNGISISGAADTISGHDEYGFLRVIISECAETQCPVTARYRHQEWSKDPVYGDLTGIARKSGERVVSIDLFDDTGTLWGRGSFVVIPGDAKGDPDQGYTWHAWSHTNQRRAIALTR